MLISRYRQRIQDFFEDSPVPAPVAGASVVALLAVVLAFNPPEADPRTRVVFNLAGSSIPVEVADLTFVLATEDTPPAAP
jgi:hypothetical protein